LTKKILAYVKKEKTNLNTMKITLNLIVSCETLGVVKSFQSTCFGHVFSKALSICNYWKKSAKAWNMFPSNPPKQICKECITWL
jgi:hypothetical protein